jgi:hypothetical protein
MHFGGIKPRLAQHLLVGLGRIRLTLLAEDQHDHRKETREGLLLRLRLCGPEVVDREPAVRLQRTGKTPHQRHASLLREVMEDMTGDDQVVRPADRHGALALTHSSSGGRIRASAGPWRFADSRSFNGAVVCHFPWPRIPRKESRAGGEPNALPGRLVSRGALVGRADREVLPTPWQSQANVPAPVSASLSRANCQRCEGGLPSGEAAHSPTAGSPRPCLSFVTSRELSTGLRVGCLLSRGPFPCLPCLPRP